MRDTSIVLCSNSCGVYVLKYMLEWNGVQMRNNFTQVHALLQFISICNFISSCTTFLTNGMPLTVGSNGHFPKEDMLQAVAFRKQQMSKSIIQGASHGLCNCLPT
jgi:hypothetical protein